jgi:hypothetical protein
MFRLIQVPAGESRTAHQTDNPTQTPTSAYGAGWRPRLGIYQFILASLGSVISIFGLALTVSTIAILYSAAGAAAEAVGSAPPAFAAIQVTTLPELAGSSSLGLPSNAGATAMPYDGAAIEAGLGVGPLTEAPAPSASDANPPRSLENVRIRALSVSSVTPKASFPLVPEPAPRPAAIVARLPASEDSTIGNAVAATPTPVPAYVMRPVDMPPALRRFDNVNITFYDCAHQGFCGSMANGRKVYEGAAACSYDLVLGTRFFIEGDPTKRIYRCEDRGLLTRTWVDIFWYRPEDGWRWQGEVGRYGSIVIVEWGTESD